MPRVVRGCAAIAATIVLVAACSGDDDSSSSSNLGPSASTTPSQQTVGTTSGTAGAGESPQSSPASIVTSLTDRLGCDVKVSGDVEREFTGKDDANAFSSDHYLSEEEVDSILELTTAVTEPTVPGEESDLTMPPRESGIALVTAWFLLNCQGGDTTFGVYSDAMSTPDDVPFQRGTYDMASPGAPDDPATLRAFIVFGTDPTPGVWMVDEGSQIEITRFDTDGAEGSFRVPMTEEFTTTGTTGRHILVEGNFDVTCKTGARCTA